ncbi:MAG: ABC transporter permease [Candidatus Eremiobacteraeota bacterium]|nr:ABC transporter permease [Candidatus Eremiobacteraeota bacterium]MBV8668005.1 ABC transporter permease [Candidatus Eremiobacteraeota bacterium]
MKIDASLLVTIAAIAVVKSTPLVYAGLGGVVSENAGVVNIGLEGMMAAGAFSAVVASFYTHDLLLALLGAVVAGAAFGLLLAYLAVTQRADQIIVGMAINVLGIGGAAFGLSAIFGQPGASPEVASFSTMSAHGPASFVARHALIWLALVLVVLLHIFLYRTKSGVHTRAVGEAPHAAMAAGIDVVRIRYAATIAGGVLAALGGAYLSIGELDLYSDGMVAGRGFIALAAVIFGRWTPFGVAAACLFFGLFSSLQIALQRADVPAQLLEMLPYVLTIVALAGFVGRTRAPAADGVPFRP